MSHRSRKETIRYEDVFGHRMRTFEEEAEVGLSQTEHTKDKLAGALREAGLEEMAKKAEAGYYHDFLSPLDAPCLQLMQDLREVSANNPKVPELMRRHCNGEFDASKEESDEWAASLEGQDTFRRLFRKE